jgi:hypothetical protein
MKKRLKAPDARVRPGRHGELSGFSAGGCHTMVFMLMLAMVFMLMLALDARRLKRLADHR